MIHLLNNKKAKVEDYLIIKLQKYALLRSFSARLPTEIVLLYKNNGFVKDRDEMYATLSQR